MVRSRHVKLGWTTCCSAELFRRVLAAPILFFLRTPVGDVLNAFARDQVSQSTAAADVISGIVM